MEQAVEKPARRPRTRKAQDPAPSPAAEDAAISAPAAELGPTPAADELAISPPAQEPHAFQALQELGRDMFLTGLVSSHTGSLSVRQDDRMLITRRGVMLGRLQPADVIEFEIGGEVPEAAAEDAVVHQAIYRSTDAKAAVYARPPWTMALALVEDRLAPASNDGADNLGSVPVLISQRNIDSPEIGQLIGRTLRESRVTAVRGQGVFARGQDLFDAFHMVSLLEEMCKVVHIYRTLAREERQPVGSEQRDRQPTNNYRPRNDGYGRRPPSGRPPQQPRRDGPPRQGDGGGGGGQPRRPFPPRPPHR